MQFKHFLNQQNWEILRCFAGYSRNESKKMNQQLSEQRAATVARALAERGVSQTRITTDGYGNTIPLSRTRAKNRRVEIEVK